MDKRVTGVTIIVFGLLAVVVLGGLQGRLTNGIGRHGPSVRVGDCAVLAPQATWGNPSDIRRSPVPVATYAECTAAGAGTVIADTDPAQLPQDATPIGYQDLISACRTPMQNYLFGLLGGDYSWDITGTHMTFRPLTAVVALPARAAAPQAPGVCVLALPGTDDVFDPIAVQAARPGDALAVCAPSWQDQQFLACTRPHRVEVMAMVTDRRIRMGVNLRGQDGCAAFLALATGRQDPTFGGQLQILMDPVPVNPAEPVMCGLGVVDPDRRLSGSLVGIDDGGLPWA